MCPISYLKILCTFDLFKAFGEPSLQDEMPQKEEHIPPVRNPKWKTISSNIHGQVWKSGPWLKDTEFKLDMVTL